MRTLSFSFLFLSFALCTGTLEAQTSTADSIGSLLPLRQAVDIAIRNNLQVNVQDLQSQTYKVAFDQSWEFMLPTLNLQGQQGINFGRSLNPTNYTYVSSQTGSGNYGLNSNIPIFEGLQLQNGIKQNRYIFDASRYDLQWQKDNITLSVLLAYLQVLSARDQLAATRAQEAADTAQLHRNESLSREGALLSLSDLTNIQGQVAQDEINIATAVNTLEANKVALFQLMNVTYKREVDYENSVNTASIADYQTSPDSLFSSALRVVPTIESSRLKVLGAEKAVQVARGAYWPTLSFGASVNTYYNGASTVGANNAKIPWGTQFKDNRSEFIGLNLNWNILNAFKIRNNVRNQKINLQTAKNNANSTRLTLQQNVELAFQNMIAAYKSYKFYNDQAIAFAESFRITDIRFTSGVVTSDIYIQAKARSDAATINLAAAKYAYIFRTKVLDYYQGRLTIP
ncbi:MAG TPA: TolC family protein [Puia sp.]|jgi:outer membrane protein|nr:TolC family protein [Puia sp.]